MKKKLPFIAQLLADEVPDVVPIEESDIPEIINIAIKDNNINVIYDLMNNDFGDKINLNYIRSRDVDFAKKVKEALEKRKRSDRGR